jgi:hypothetical protein
MPRPIFVLALFLYSLAAPVLPAQDGEPPLAQLLRLKDDADPALVSRAAAARTREAAEGLVKALDLCGSLLMRREIVRSFGVFDGVPEAEQVVLQKAANVAANAEDVELREAALGVLGRSPRLGKHFLKLLVDSEASDAVREPALREHVKNAAVEDADWYRYLWNLKGEQRKDKDGKIVALELGPIRLLAFQGLAKRLAEDELIETLRRELDPKIRRAALAAMRERNLPKTWEMAEWVLQRVDFPGADRAEAARLLFDKDGPKAVNLALELIKKRDTTPDDLRAALAACVVQLNDDATNKRVAKLVGKGKPHERVFALEAAGKHAELKAVRKELQEPALEVRRAAAKVLVQRDDREALPDLRTMLQKGRNPGDARLAIEAIGELEKGNDAWLLELEAFAGHADADVRNAALELIGAGRYKRQIPVLVKALDHEDWSTRFAAVEALLQMRDKRGVGPLVERIGKDPGRLAKRIGEVLWQLTAQPFDDDARRWQAWWQDAKVTFEVVGQKDLEKAEGDRELARLKARTRSTGKFFGIQVESQRVLFIVDVSGSMLESVYGRYVGKRGAARIDVARQELTAAIESLEPSALFNVIAFSTGVAKWRPDISGSNTPALRAQALQWVERLGANGATNLYDSLKQGFADKDVDMIYLMSDGEPTNGEVIDPARIRAEVAYWNRHRKVKIHTVAIGANLEILEWLAADSGGKHVKIR